MCVREAKGPLVVTSPLSAGWRPERQQYPDSLHCTIMPSHVGVEDTLLGDLRDAAKQVKVSTEVRVDHQRLGSSSRGQGSD